MYIVLENQAQTTKYNTHRQHNNDLQLMAVVL